MASRVSQFDIQDAQIIDDEFGTFCDNLEKIQSKFIDDWIETYKEKCEQEITKQYENSIAECGADIEKLQRQIEDQTLRSSQMKDTLEKLEELEDLKTKLKKQQATEHKSLEELTNKLQTETKDVEALEKITVAKKERLSKALKFFRERLGLEFKNMKGEEQIKVIFTNIDENDQEQQFSFNTKIVESSYLITGCVPPIEELDTYVAELNNSNNFQRFIIKMRSAFKTKLQDVHSKENNPPTD